MVTREVLGDWLINLHHAESATLTACGALRATELTEALCVADTLEIAGANALFSVIEGMQKAISSE